MTKLIKFRPTGRNDGASPPIYAIYAQFEANLDQIGTNSRFRGRGPEANIVNYFTVIV